MGDDSLSANQGPSNAELKRLIEKTLVRIQNWRVEMEANPNPRMVHQLKNLVSIIDSLSEITENRMQYSYKQLAHRMALLVNETAQLNLRITSALSKDDYLDEERSGRSPQPGVSGAVPRRSHRDGPGAVRLGPQASGTIPVQPAHSTHLTLSGAVSAAKMRS
jgi:hypothetical protein